MTVETIKIITLSIIALVGIIAGGYFYLRDKSMKDIRVDAYKWFKEAKKNGSLESGKDKMIWALQQAREFLPAWARIFVTDAFLEKTMQRWFEEVEDLLDDGEINGSTKETKEE